jgi:hypothetical protein
MIEKKKGKDHERVKERALGQPIATQERKGSKMVISKRIQHRHIERRKGGYNRKPYKRRGSFVFLCTKVIYKLKIGREVVGMLCIIGRNHCMFILA